MEWLPQLQLGWFNGWVLLAVWYGVFGLMLALLPRDVVARLYDRSGWSRQLSILSAMRTVFALPAFVLITFSPLKVGCSVFSVGLLIFALGLAGFVAALWNFRNTPSDRPATVGLYRVSRNPQALTFFLALYGITLTIGSWIALLTVAACQLFAHFRILAEEAACLRQYGDAYRAYMRRVPRYFLFL